eukprot:3338015-Ditylum_brightwellii.AAC.1
MVSDLGFTQQALLPLPPVGRDSSLQESPPSTPASADSQTSSDFLRPLNRQKLHFTQLPVPSSKAS